ncbi:TetR family transcriptional regulator [Mycolicibacterium chitae]|uniref:Transcriptional regulator n=1 Tax=Mycolicibacterium chitae TaxID=1792 RepID=A0A3S4SVV0_MYCCI|nr:TetR/AcrR family transcriptional regulator [Mycolicibacterium chitae]MCV7109033.1 TetR/AcrR family transcriptional regulator [Mycolicibacterium chitae]BBZ02310.1 TetR family transcriptional regulator [Mycolicibacterium chitae]VEG44645.1 transcriptional regulator [Mycolicibacterium chitae]
MATTRRGRPTRAEAAQLDQTVREAAVATFLECGYDGATMEAIATAAGITKRSLYARYADKRSIFAEVIPWALSRYEAADPVDAPNDDDVEAALLAVAREALKRATDPANVRLTRIAMSESARFPEFGVTADSMMWSGRQRAVVDVLRRGQAKGVVQVDDIELAAEQFLAMVELLPGRLADFGIYRSKRREERHLRHAVALFLRGAMPR